MLSPTVVAEHNSRSSCWVIISGNVYDVTQFLDSHPGGANVILRFAGKDATEEYEPIHAPGTIEEHLPREMHLGSVSSSPSSPTGQSAAESLPPSNTEVPKTTQITPYEPLPLSACKSIDDLEHAARVILSPKARTYFESAAETLTSAETNRADWKTITFRPRVLRNVSNVSMRCKIMGSWSTLPIFIAPAAAARLGHEDGELCLARGAARMAIPQCVCTYSSVAPRSVMSCFQQDPGRRGGALFFQLYVPKAKADAKKLISQAISAGFEALVVTVDSAVIGKRDDDDRFKALIDYDAGLLENNSQTEYKLPGEEAATLRGVHCSSLEWSDLDWIQECWGDRPIIVKGIQTAEDALEAASRGIKRIYLSNHGGRQLDYAPSAVQVLLEIRQHCPEILRKVEIYVDGGIKRGTDVVKALCLGARAVGIGRGFMFALGAYGTEGVLKAIQILSDEIQTTMRLLGVSDISQLNLNFISSPKIDRIRRREKGARI